MNEFLGFFLDEAVDILVGWEATSLRLEQDSSAETKDELYRAAHNLKSGSGAVGLDDFHHLVHAVEDLISKVMGEEGPLDSAIVRIFLDTHSCLSAWVDRLRAGDESCPQDEIEAIRQALKPFLGALRTYDAEAEIEADETESAPSKAEKVSLVLPSDEPLIDFHAMAAPAQASVAAAPLTPTAPSLPTASLSQPVKAQETIRVAAVKLDNLIELVGELATQQAIVWHGRQLGSLDSENCDNAIHLIQKIAKDLQSLSLSLRLQPLQSLFQRLERTVRDLARSQDKRIDVVIKGEDVELDKSVAERIADALTHIVRNAIDHGVETSMDRIENGKSPAATITLEAVPAANGVIIRISDDGRGLNADRIRKKALEKGLLSEATVQSISEAEVHRLIFHAGLSTAEKITDVSGRGVGMDVVKTSVENIGGSIQLTSILGRGTTFSISLPATLSIVDALLVTADQNLYAIPLQDVAEIIDLNEVEIQAMPGGARLLRLRNSVIPLENLSAHLPDDTRHSAVRFAMAAKGQDHSSIMRPAILVRAGDNICAFEVDTLSGQQLVTVRGLPSAIAQIPGYTGGTILGDGNPCVVLNLVALASRHYEEIQRGVSQSLSPSQPFITQSKFEENDSRYLIMENGAFIFATSLMMVREILEETFSENLLGPSEAQHEYVAVRGELIPVFDMGSFSEGTLPRGGTYVVTSDGRKAFSIERVLAVSTLETVLSHTGHDLDLSPGVLGFRRYQDKYIPLIDLDKALHQKSQGSYSEGRTAS